MPRMTSEAAYRTTQTGAGVKNSIINMHHRRRSWRRRRRRQRVVGSDRSVALE